MKHDFWDYVVGDIECNGLSPTRLFMIGVQDMISGEYRSFVGPDEVAEASYYMAMTSKIVCGHSFRSFDAKWIKNLTTLEISGDKIIDTVEVSRRFMKKFENHKLKTWGEFFDYPKLEAPLFEHFTPQMIPYCQRDVNLNRRVFDYLFEQAVEQNRLTDIHSNVDLLMEYANLRYP